MCPLPRAVARICSQARSLLRAKVPWQCCPQDSKPDRRPLRAQQGLLGPTCIFGVGMCGEVLFLHSPSLFPGLQSEQWGPDSPFTPPSIGHPPRSRRDFGKEINTRWERAGLPGTHSLHAKSCWREWARGPGRVGGAPSPGDCSPCSPGLSSQPRVGQLERGLHAPTPLCPQRCPEGREHIHCADCTEGGCHPPCWGIALL